MKFSTIATGLLLAAGTVSATGIKKYIITYPSGTDQPSVDKSAQHLEESGCTIRHRYHLIKALAVECPDDAMENFQIWAQGHGQNPTIEEDQIVTIQNNRRDSSE
ncbi:hypothetical protein K440DRAFT_386828 [Wilcoxina mikolae CBS 423.85]|nr:hypothetical protein K440DRAFT_386828 [Wilcoxina mikolae CBS 423.85]